MRIATNTISSNLITQIQDLNSQQASLQAEVSSGRKLTNPSDDPAAMGRVLNMQAEQASLSHYASNASRALSISQASYSGLSSLKTISDRAGQIATLGTGTNGAAANSAYGSEVDQLIEQAVQTANSKFGNDYLYAGSAVGTAPITSTRNASGQITSVAYAGNTQQVAIPLSDTSSVAPGTDHTTNTGLRDLINNLISLRDALNTNNSAAVAATQPNLTTTENTLVTSLADAGAVQTRIEASQTQQQNLSTALTALISSETDADLPSTVVKLTQAQTAYQAALQTTASIMKTSLMDYLK